MSAAPRPLLIQPADSAQLAENAANDLALDQLTCGIKSTFNLTETIESSAAAQVEGTARAEPRAAQLNRRIDEGAPRKAVR